jgi:ANTAR domain
VATDQPPTPTPAVQALERLGWLSLRELSMEGLLPTVAHLAKTVMPGHPEASVSLLVEDLPTRKGILMDRCKLTAEQPFQVLAQMSIETNRKLRPIADDLVHTGELLRGLAGDDTPTPARGTDRITPDLGPSGT